MIMPIDLTSEKASDRLNEITDRLEQVSPVPIAFENIPGSAYGYYSPTLAM